MKLIHIGDLHIGKRVNEFSMIEDQKYILKQILRIITEEKPNGILIAGDVYDKSLPSAEAVRLLDDFLTSLTSFGQPVFMISGNHDSPERLGFGNRLLEKNGLYIAGVFQGSIEKISLKDTYGMVHIHLLPFLKPAMIKPYFEESIETYDDALRLVISSASIDPAERNILLAHQFVINGTQTPKRFESETISIGGLDQVDASSFDSFDYVALGHLHGPQKIRRDSIRYSGSPLKYSFSEARHQKSVVVVELKDKDDVSIHLIPLTPLHDLREIKGPIDELLKIGREDTQNSMDYIHATLTDEEEIYDAIGQLREVYPNLMLLDFENSHSHTSDSTFVGNSNDTASKSSIDLFAEFYQLQNNIELSDNQIKVMEQILEQTKEDTI